MVSNGNNEIPINPTPLLLTKLRRSMRLFIYSPCARTWTQSVPRPRARGGRWRTSLGFGSPAPAAPAAAGGTDCVQVRLPLLRQFWSGVDDCYFSQRCGLIGSKTRKRDEFEIPRSVDAREFNTLWSERRRQFAACNIRPHFSIVAGLNSKLTNITFMLAMILPRHQHHSRHCHRRTKSDRQLRRLASRRSPASATNKRSRGGLSCRSPRPR